MIETAKAVNIPTDQQVLHVLTQEFIVDGQEDIREPIGMSGLRLEVRAISSRARSAPRRTSSSACAAAGLEVQDLDPAAPGLQPGVPDRRREGAGVVLVDIGGGTTDVAIFTGGAIRHTAVIPDRGRPDHQRHRGDAAHAHARCRGNQAALRRGQASAGASRRGGRSAGPGDRGPRQVKRQALGAVIEPRVEELFTLIQQVVRDSGYEDLLAWAWCSPAVRRRCPAIELAEDVFLKPVRLAVPEYEGSP